MRIECRAQALADIDGIERYLKIRSVEAARTVVRGIYDSIRAIAQTPNASEQTNEPGLRVKIVRRYRYKIFYRVVGEIVRITHIRHTSRRPRPKD